MAISISLLKLKFISNANIFKCVRVRTYVFFFSFLSFIDTWFLLCDSKPCTYYIYIYIHLMRLLLHFFAEGSDEAVSLRLKWHTIAVSSKLFPFLLIGLLSLFQILTWCLKRKFS